MCLCLEIECLRQKLSELETSSVDICDGLQAQLEQKDETIHRLQQDVASLEGKRDWYHSEVMMLSACNSAVFYSNTGMID